MLEFKNESVLEPTKGLEYNYLLADKPTDNPLEKLQFAYDCAKQTGKLIYDIETSGLSPFEDKPLLLQFGFENKGIDWAYVMRASLNIGPILDLFREIFSNPDIKVIGHNLSFEYKFTKYHYQVGVNNVWDTQVVESLLTMGKNEFTDLGAVTKRRLGVELDKTYQKSFIKMRQDSPFTRQQFLYAGEDVVVPYQIYLQQKEEVVRDGLRSVEYIENHNVPILSQTHLNGVKLDKEKWIERAEPEILKRIELIREIMKYFKIEETPIPQKVVGLFDEPTPPSTQDLLDHLVNISQIQSNVKLMNNLHKIGVHTSKVDKEAFKELKGNHPIIKLLVEEKTIRTRINMFWLKWLAGENKETKLWHPEYKQLPVRDDTGRKKDEDGSGATTGRMSCPGLNVQQIPADKLLRTCFIPTIEGRMMVTADYSSMEARIAANLSRDPALIEFFKGKVKDKFGNPVVDIHGYNCSVIFKLPLEDCIKLEYIDEATGKLIEVDPKETKKRKIAKIGVFAVIYGANAYALSKQLDIPLEEAEDFYKRMTKAYPTLMKYLKKVYEEAIQLGYVTDSVGRRKYFDTTDEEVRRFMSDYNRAAERDGYATLSYEKAKEKVYNRIRKQTGNFKIQASAASMLKYAILLVGKEMKGRELILYAFIHDEIVAQVKPETAEDDAAFIKACMIKSMNKLLPGPVSYDVGVKLESTWIK